MQRVETAEWTQMRPSSYPDYNGVTEYVGGPDAPDLVPRRVIPFTYAGCVEAEQAQRERPAPFRPRGAPRVRAGFAERHPATTTIGLQQRTRTRKTRDGLPVTWPWAGGGDDEKRRKLQAERDGTRPEHHVEVGLDLGRACPIAAQVSAGVVDSPCGRVESTIVMTGGGLKQINSQTSRERSNLANWFGEGFKERVPLMNEEEEEAAGGENGGKKVRPSAPSSRRTSADADSLLTLALSLLCSSRRRTRCTTTTR